MTTSCPTCGSPVRVVGDETEGTMHYEPVQFDPSELKRIAEWGRVVIDWHGADVLPETLERMRALRSRVLQLAFMETCRHA